MTTDLTDVLNKADGSFVAKHQAEIGQAEHIAYSTAIYTDGTYTTKVDPSTGYIHILNVNKASYLIYLDRNQKVILYIYENILPTVIKSVYDDLEAIRNEIVESPKNETSEESISSKYIQDVDNITYGELKSERYKRHLVLNFEGLVDINDMICDVCGGSEFLEPILCEDGHTIECQCAECYSIFRLVPSRFYAVDSRTVFVRNDIMKANKNVLNKYLPFTSNMNKQINVILPKKEKSINPNQDIPDNEDILSDILNPGEYVND